MEIENDYIRFEKVGDTGKTKIWNVVSKKHGNVLGTIKWYGAWRQYTFQPEDSTVFNPECLDTISRFIRNEMYRRDSAKLCAGVDQCGIFIEEIDGGCYGNGTCEEYKKHQSKGVD